MDLNMKVIFSTSAQNLEFLTRLRVKEYISIISVKDKVLLTDQRSALSYLKHVVARGILCHLVLQVLTAIIFYTNNPFCDK